MSQLIRVNEQPVWDRLCPEWRIVPQPVPGKIIRISVDQPVCRAGEEIVFRIEALSSGVPKAGERLLCEISRDFHPVEKLELLSRSDSPAELRTRLEKPGFIRLNVSCRNYKEAALGAGVEPEKITAAPEVEGFDEFWHLQKLRLATVPAVELMREEVALDSPDFPGVRCFDVQVACAGNAPVSGMLAMPEHAGKGTLPAYVFFHGAGVRPAFQPLPWAAKGLLAFNVNAHGLPNRGGAGYFRNMAENILRNCESRQYDAPEKSIFCDMTMRVMRALEYVKSLPEWDGKTLIVHGGSQGGYQTLAAAGLDDAVTFVVINAPAMCNLAGALQGRTPSWPNTVRPDTRAESVRAACFCDGATFAARAKAEAVFTVGFSDSAAVPSSVYAAYNAYRGPKRMLEFHDLGHETSVFWTGGAEMFEHIRNRK